MEGAVARDAKPYCRNTHRPALNPVGPEHRVTGEVDLQVEPNTSIAASTRAHPDHIPYIRYKQAIVVESPDAT